ncbi:MAG: histidinol-phosphate transaminase [Candidatus Micrarchaeia archaeon]
MEKLDKLVRKAVAQCVPYTCARDLYKKAEAFLDANENSFGSCIGNASGVELNRYPDSDQLRLRREIAMYAGVRGENVLVGNGSDEIIDLCIRAFVGDGDNIISFEPGYSMYSACAQVQGAKTRQVLLDKDFQPDVKAAIAASDNRTKIVFLVSPNSPVGTQVELERIEELAKKTGAILFVDEAYIEFGGKTAAPLVEKYNNLIISRTFSKAWGLAGLRVGYAISNKRIISILKNLKAPYNVNSLSAALATKALRIGKKKMQGNAVKMRKEREMLRTGLSSLGFFVYPSVCNFLLARPPPCTITATELQGQLAAKGIIVRDRSSMPLLSNTMRITIGTPQQNRKLMICIRSALGKNAGFDTVLFDMDGVLVDVSKSYRIAIEKTANDYFAGKNMGCRVTQKEVAKIKSNPGFNNDWDATYALVKATQGKRQLERTTPLGKGERRSGLYAELKEAFQELYLSGLIQKETPLIGGKTLEAIAGNGMKIGIVTGRPRAEAEFAVRNNGWGKYFPAKSIMALEDCDEEKPSPKPLLLAARKMDAKNPIYVGDSPSDSAACKAAGIPCVIVGNGARGDWNVLKTDGILAVIR